MMNQMYSKSILFIIAFSLLINSGCYAVGNSSSPTNLQDPELEKILEILFAPDDAVNKPYKCDQCAYASARKDALTRHMRTHTGERPYKCDQCGYAAAEKSTLTTHMRTHTGEKPFKCDQCDYASIQRAHLSRHITKHTGQKPFKCDQCDYAATTSGGLTRHMHKHERNAEMPPAKIRKTS